MAGREKDKAPPDEDVAAEGAPSPMEGPPPPGAAPPAEPALEAPLGELRERAAALGVMPTEGSGSGGAVVKADIVEALASAPEPPAGRPPLAAVAEKAAEQLLTRED